MYLSLQSITKLLIFNLFYAMDHIFLSIFNSLLILVHLCLSPSLPCSAVLMTWDNKNLAPVHIHSGALCELCFLYTEL